MYADPQRQPCAAGAAIADCVQKVVCGLNGDTGMFVASHGWQIQTDYLVAHQPFNPRIGFAEYVRGRNIEAVDEAAERRSSQFLEKGGPTANVGKQKWPLAFNSAGIG